MVFSIFAFVFVMAVFAILICIAVWRLIKANKYLMIALLGIELTVLGTAAVLMNKTGSLLLSVAGHVLTGAGIILNLAAVFTAAKD